MKVLQVMPEFGVAGAETMCKDLSLELKKLGVDVVVVSLYDYHSSLTEQLESAGVKVIYLGKKRGFDLRMKGRLYKVFKEEKPDAIHMHRHLMQYAVPAAKKAKIKNLFYTVHSIASNENNKIALYLNKIYFKRYGVCPVALSGIVQESVIAQYGLKKGRIPIVFNGVNLTKCTPKTDYSLKGKFTIIHVGRFCDVKNHTMLLTAFLKFNRQIPNSRLVLVGDGEGRSAAEAFVAKNGLTESVEFAGLQANVFPYLAKADIFTLPSKCEGMPLTIIEAMGTGLPIVATKVGGTAALVDNGVEGILTPVDSDELADAFVTLAKDSAVREKYGKNGLKKAKLFSARRMAEEYIKLYEQGKLKR